MVQNAFLNTTVTAACLTVFVFLGIVYTGTVAIMSAGPVAFLGLTPLDAVQKYGALVQLKLNRFNGNSSLNERRACCICGINTP